MYDVDASDAIEVAAAVAIAFLAFPSRPRLARGTGVTAPLDLVATEWLQLHLLIFFHGGHRGCCSSSSPRGHAPGRIRPVR